MLVPGSADSASSEPLPSGTGTGPALQGFLHKQGDDLRGKWTQRWFVFEDQVLKYYRKRTDASSGTVHGSGGSAVAPAGEIHASTIRSVAVASGVRQQKHSFEVLSSLERGDWMLAASILCCMPMPLVTNHALSYQFGAW